MARSRSRTLKTVTAAKCIAHLAANAEAEV